MDWFASFINGFTLPVVLCIVLGILLLIIEMFIPGFGVAGGLGIVFLLAAVVLRADSVQNALIMLAILLLLIGGAAALFLRSASGGRISRSKYVLNDAIGGKSERVNPAQRQEYLGLSGSVLTPLRPAGTADFDGKWLDVVSEGDYIEKGTRVQIIQIEGPRIVVRATDA